MNNCLIAPFVTDDNKLKMLLKSERNISDIIFNPISFKFDCENNRVKDLLFIEFKKHFESDIKKDDLIFLGDISNKIFLFGVNLNNKKIKDLNDDDDYSWISYFLRFDNPYISMLYIRLIGYINLNDYRNKICPECKRPLKINLKEN